MGTESQYWRDHVRPSLSSFGMIVRVENAARIGTPDVAYCLRPTKLSPAVSGWLELKSIPTLPARASTKLTVPHLTKEQVDWQIEWMVAGGRVFTLIRIEDRHVLVRPGVLKRLYQHELAVCDLLDLASVFAIGAFPAGRVLKCLTEI